ncbi:MAG: LytTR family transcriptional regulator DNA-binding domain-containing protein [Bacteroidetes bacterium]|nr:LytTR family transcriptional regulator DNA-binding domain-containing protein [Bacteroidota bacterium]MCL2301768.1 LytTR family transcriptional regulator DNA-binding domain-containing protein [Lentimicrobiaceae bacterium]
MKIRLINRHLPGILLFAIISGIVLVIINGLSILPVLIIIFPIQLLLWVLLYLFIFKHDRSKDDIFDAKDVRESVENNCSTKKELIETIAVKSGKKLHIIPISEIVCLQAYGDYVNIMTLQGTYLKEQTLKYFEEHLPEEQFLRVHRSHIVNLRAIDAIERYGREQYLLILSNKEKVKATLEGYKRLKEVLKL